MMSREVAVLTTGFAIGLLAAFAVPQAVAQAATNEPPPSAGMPAAASPAEGQGAVPSVAEPPETPGEPSPPPPPLAPPLPPLPPPPPTTPRYGDQGTPEIALGIGYSSTTGFLGAAGFHYFVIPGLAPGVEGTYVSGGTGGSAYGLVLASLRLVPLRTRSIALVLTGRAGRMFLTHHDDGWGAGGAAGVLFILSQGLRIEVGYEALKLFPASFCADLRTCVLHGPVLGLRLVL